ncbi:histidine kinase N-terminal domain-containing protein [Peribacillus sp. B-H-3]|uniref:histidine kinase N-terminal domain-containing protein n=1 Tax=Peribacillus sp. B-H-3 TaxID=3400420 RepID=UPI003B0298CB
MESSSGKKDYNQLAVLHLVKQQDVFLSEWFDSAKKDEHDPFLEKILENGSSMYQIIVAGISGKLSQNELKDLANKVAHERLEAHVNVGDFVYNVNLGRSIIVKNIIRSEISAIELQKIIDEINHLFNLFCYHAVSYYTNLQNQELKEKNLFISENHKDKLAVLGQISSSFVHEFRNPLTAIMGFNKILKNEHPDIKYLDIIEHELNQLNFRITQFLHTSKAEINPKTRDAISIAALIKDIQMLIYPSTADNDINVSIDIDRYLVIEANEEELKQVLLNLFINSIDALKTQPKPRNILVKGFSAENEGIIMISNNGPVIAAEHIKTIFEPFFTTKELGTGIGLFVCKKIIEKHGGNIACTPSHDLTTFSIRMPLHAI